ncbi:glutamate receptor ionotropic, delta-2 isoform X2 [Bombyx mandarina]|uniref:Glutamate receptor ionotropic, delta-2 isoform X2 n=1 Tax=Bombyx mandarina TaxID=7092 RepID=A0A6J2KBX1_BOMMA|nr:glutamate receptor ionotropic, delta-2 isoform X2 [Bombyx mandarina]
MAGIELIISSICNATICNAVYDNPLTDGHMSQKESETLLLANEINGKHLKIGTYNNFPLSWIERDENGTVQAYGVAFKIIDILQQKFNFTYEIVIPHRNFEIGGSKPEDSLIGLTNASKVDMIAAFIPRLVRFRKLVTFSRDLDEGVWMMMLRRPKESAAGSGLLAPFNNFVWYVTLASVLCYGPCICFLTHVRSKLIKNEERPLRLSPSFWFVYSAFIKQSTNLAPEANTTRVLFATWWLFIILLSAFYTANLTAFLTLSKFTLDIETPEDLYKKNYRWVSVEGGSVQHTVKTQDEDLYYLNKMVASGRAEFRTLSPDQEYLPIVKAGAVLVKEMISLEHLMYGDYLTKTREGVEEAKRCTYVVAPKPFMKKPRAFVYPVGSKLKSLFDPTLAYILQSGIIDYLEHKDLPSTTICPLDLQSKDRQLTNSHLMMTYYIMCVGLASGLAVFVVEILVKRYINIKIKPIDKVKLKKFKRSKRSPRYDDSGPPPYESLFVKPKFKGSEKRSKMINGREYYVYEDGRGGTRLIPVRTPSAFLYR